MITLSPSRPDQLVTVLAVELRRRQWDRQDCVEELSRAARTLGLRTFALSVRQLDRLLKGQVQAPRAKTGRVLEHVFGQPVEVLLSPPLSALEPKAIAGEPPEITPREWVVRTGQQSRDHAAVSAAGGVGTATVEQLQSEVCRLAHAYASSPPLALLVNLMRTRDLAFDLLAQTRRPAQLAELFLIAGQVCGLAATTVFDLGFHDTADDHARAAWTYAELIDHHPLRAWSRGVQATIAFWSGRPQAGLQYVASGLPFATGPSAMRLHAIGARSWALMRAEENARRCLRQALEERDRHAAGDELTDEIGGEFAFGTARVALCAGAVHLALGDGVGAARYSGEALRLHQKVPASDRRWAVEHGARMDLATARVLRNDLDGAEAVLGPALNLENERRTARLAQRLNTLRSAVEESRYRSAPIARRMTEAIDDFSSAALTRSSRLALPPGG